MAAWSDPLEGRRPLGSARRRTSPSRTPTAGRCSTPRVPRAWPSESGTRSRHPDRSTGPAGASRRCAAAGSCSGVRPSCRAPAGLVGVVVGWRWTSSATARFPIDCWSRMTEPSGPRLRPREGGAAARFTVAPGPSSRRDPVNPYSPCSAPRGECISGNRDREGYRRPMFAHVTIRTEDRAASERL